MNYKIILLLLTILPFIHAQHEDIPYQDVAKICETCVCLSAQDATKHFHQTLSCAMKNFKHILARWPEEFGKNHNDVDIVATFSGNSIELLQQLPATNATLTFSCSHCGIKRFQVPTFMDVPNIRRLDLSWNEITTDELTPDVFRGPYHATRYEPISLRDLDLSHNQLNALDKHQFEHTPNLTKLNLSFNKFSVFNMETILALSSAKNLKVLDLSYTDIKTIPTAIFKSLVNVNTLNLAGNKLDNVPDDLHLIGQTLEVLNLANNPIQRLHEKSFYALNNLKRLNISDMIALRTITKTTFWRLHALEYLDCARNARLQQFDLGSLLPCANLTYLDISYCGISTLSVGMDLSEKSNNNTNNTAISKPWPHLYVFETVGNPWLCDCELLQTLEFVGSHHCSKDTETRCESPYIFAGARLSNLTAKQVCSMQIPKKYRVIDEDPPRFLRKRYIILTLITAAVVIVLGLLLGFVIACIRRRLKREDYGIEPIRYTSVRSSNLSAFSHVNPANGRTSV